MARPIRKKRIRRSMVCFLSSKIGSAQDAPVSFKVRAGGRTCVRNYIACIPDLIKRKGPDENRWEILPRDSPVKKFLYALNSLLTIWLCFPDASDGFLSVRKRDKFNKING